MKKSKLPNIKYDEFYNDCFTQDWCPIDRIEAGMIKTKDKYGGRWIKIIRLHPTNFATMPNAKKNAIAREMFYWLKNAPSYFSLHSESTKKDINELIERIYKKTENETNPKMLERRDKYIEKIRNLTATDALSNNFYITIPFEGAKNADINVVFEQLMGQYALVKNHFSSMGNRVEEPENYDLFLANICFKELNPTTSKTETVTERMGRVSMDREEYASSIRCELEEIDMVHSDFLAQKGLDCTHNDFTISDGMFTSCMFLKADGYNSRVYLGWVSTLSMQSEGISVTITAKKADRDKSVTKAKYAAVSHKSNASAESGRDAAQEESLAQADNATYIRRALSIGLEDFYHVCIELRIEKPTYKELIDTKITLKKRLKSLDYFLYDAYKHQEEALLMSYPFLAIDDFLFEKTCRNMTSWGVASTYFFTSYELFNENGYLLGYNANNSSLAVVDMFDRQAYSNANMVILGTSGHGKTFLLLMLGYAMRASGVPVFYILPEKGYEYIRATQAIGGEYIKLAPGSKACVNIMALRPQRELDEHALAEYDAIIGSLLSQKINAITTFIQLCKPKEEMTDTEETQLQIVLTKLYKDFGITEDNDSIWDNKEERKLKIMPTISDLYERALNDEILKDRIAVAIRPFVEGSCSNLNGQTNVDLTNPYTVFDVSGAGRYLAPFSFIATDICYDTIKSDRAENSILFLDEAWFMMENDTCAGFIMNLFKLIRGYGSSVAVSTQNISDLLGLQDGFYGKRIISNAQIKFLLGVSDVELEELSGSIGLTSEEEEELKSLPKGKALLIANTDKVFVDIVATQEEVEIFTTDATILQQLREEGRI